MHHDQLEALQSPMLEAYSIEYETRLDYLISPLWT